MSSGNRAIKLVPLGETHIDKMVEWRSRTESQEHQPITALGRDFLLRFIEKHEDADVAELSHPDYILMIEDAERQQDVGWLTLEILSKTHGLARIGYTIAKEYWNLGYATTAVEAIVRRLFETTPVKRIEADCSIHNHASQRVLEKNGFRHVGIKREYLVIRGTRVDHHYYELTHADFLRHGTKQE